MLLIRLLHSATVLHSNSYYTVIASIFLVSAASCKAICGVGVTIHWTGLLDWTSGLDYWTMNLIKFLNAGL